MNVLDRAKKALKDKLTPERLFTSGHINNYLQTKAANMLKQFGCSARNVYLFFNPRSLETAYTESTRIIINTGCMRYEGSSYEDMHGRFINVLGALTHEVGHILFTSFTAARLQFHAIENGSFYPSEPVVSDELKDNYKLLKEMLEKRSGRRVLSRISKKLANALEDGRIEKLLFATVRNARKPLTCLRYKREKEQKMFVDLSKYIEIVNSGERRRFEVLFELVYQQAKYGEIKGYDPKYNNEDLVKLFHKVEPYIDRYVNSLEAYACYDCINTILVVIADDILSYWNEVRQAMIDAKERLKEATGKGDDEEAGCDNDSMPPDPEDIVVAPNAPEGEDGVSKDELPENAYTEDDFDDDEIDKDDPSGEGDDNSSEESESDGDESSDQSSGTGAGSEESDNEQSEGSDRSDESEKKTFSSDLNPEDDAKDLDDDTSTQSKSKDNGTGEDESESDESDESDESGGGISREEDENESEGEDAGSGTSESSDEDSGKDNGDNDSSLSTGDSEADENTDDSLGQGQEDGAEDEPEVLDEEVADAIEQALGEIEEMSQDSSDQMLDNGEHEAAMEQALKNLCDKVGAKNLDELSEMLGDALNGQEPSESVESDLQGLFEQERRDIIDEEEEDSLRAEYESISRSDLGDVHNHARLRYERPDVTDYEIAIYENILPQIKKTSRAMGRKVKFKKDDDLLPVNKQYYGTKLSAPADPYNRMFTKNKREKAHKNVSVAVVIDESGSMSGEREQFATITASIFYDFCIDNHVKCTILGHSVIEHDWSGNGGDLTRIKVYADSGKSGKPDPNDKYRLMNISADGCNRDGYAIRTALKRLEKDAECTKLLFVISDGKPNASGYKGDTAKEDLKDIVKYCERNRIVLICAAIGEDKDLIKDFYGANHFLDITDPNELPIRMGALVKALLK